MPGTVQSPDNPKKRKRTAPKDVDATIATLESEIQESQRHYNNIPKLLAMANTEATTEKASTLAATAALGRVFFRLLAEGRLRIKNGASKEEEVIVSWLKKNYISYQKCLLELLKNVYFEATALRELMQLVNAEITNAGAAAESVWRTGVFGRIIDNLLGLDEDESLGASGSNAVRAFAEEYAQKFDDIRHATFTLIADRLSKIPRNSDVSHRAIAASLELLCALELPIENLDFCNATPFSSKKPRVFKITTTHKNRGQAAWLALLSSSLDKSQKKNLLNLMTHRIVPWFPKVELLMDFLTDAFNAGGATSLLALSGLFYLMTEKNLDYPDFYLKLYSLLDETLLHSKHRSRFFRLLNIFMSSTHLPAAMVASFIKRLSRLALHAPPAAIVAVVPWVYNMLKAHPACTFMIHREPRTDKQREQLEQQGMDDPFSMAEADPMETGALESCLWELYALQSHYHPNVASLAQIMSEQFTKVSYNLDDFLDHSYASLIDAELGKDLKKTPVVEFDIPKRIFTQLGEEPGVLEGLMESLLEVIEE